MVSSTSRSVGTRVYFQTSSFLTPASSALISASVIAETGRSTPQVRSGLSSCMQMISPSFERWKSPSMQTAPRAQASVKDSSVFSGAISDSPRCATILTAMIGQSSLGYFRQSQENITSIPLFSTLRIRTSPFLTGISTLSR